MNKLSDAFSTEITLRYIDKHRPGSDIIFASFSTMVGEVPLTAVHAMRNVTRNRIRDEMERVWVARVIVNCSCHLLTSAPYTSWIDYMCSVYVKFFENRLMRIKQVDWRIMEVTVEGVGLLSKFSQQL